MNAPTYHDLFITTETIERTSIFDLPYSIQVYCNRVGGWTVYQNQDHGPPKILAGEYEGAGCGLRLDVAGHVIVDSMP